MLHLVFFPVNENINVNIAMLICVNIIHFDQFSFEVITKENS